MVQQKDSIERITSFSEGEIWEFTFPQFTAVVTFHAGPKLTLKVREGLNAGFTDTVDYEAVSIREGLVVLSWREHIGSTVVHVLDLHANQTYTVVASAKGDLMRMQGSLRRASAGWEEPTIDPSEKRAS
jgi:hypothetical protein